MASWKVTELSILQTAPTDQLVQAALTAHILELKHSPEYNQNGLFLALKNRLINSEVPPELLKMIEQNRTFATKLITSLSQQAPLHCELLGVSQKLKDSCPVLAISPCGNKIITASLDRKKVHLWVLKKEESSASPTYKEKNSYALKYPIQKVEFSQKGTHFGIIQQKSGSIGLVQTTQSGVVNCLDFERGPITATAFHEKCERRTLFAAASCRGAIKIRSLSDNMNKTLDIDQGAQSNCLNFNGDGTLLAAASNDSTVTLYDTQTGTTLNRLPHVLTSSDTYIYPKILSAVFSPKERYIASQLKNPSSELITYLWNMKDGTHSEIKIGSPIFSSDERYLVGYYDDCALRVYDLQTKSLLHHFDFFKCDGDKTVPGKIEEILPLSENLFAIRKAQANGLLNLLDDTPCIKWPFNCMPLSTSTMQHNDKGTLLIGTNEGSILQEPITIGAATTLKGAIALHRKRQKEPVKKTHSESVV